MASRTFRQTQLELINLKIELHESSIRDPLTGIKNRRYFDTTMDIEWKRGVRNSKQMALMLIDIDHFKRVNDSYGHPKGDEVLIAVAKLLEKNMQRAGEFVSRLGGEEFAIVIPNSDENCSILFAEKLRLEISSLVFQDDASKNFSITASFGTACAAPNPHNRQKNLFKFADKALYIAKNEGRNCTRIHHLTSNELSQQEDTVVE